MVTARFPANVIACRPAHLVYLAQEMRVTEQEQFRAVTGIEQYDPDVAAQHLVNTAARSGPFALTVIQRDGLPACAGGFEPAGTPGVWQSWMVGTESGWAEQWRSMTKATRWLMDHLLSQRAHRLQTSSLVTRTKAMEWFERSLGMKPEGVWRAYGAQGEDIAHFSRLRGE